MSANQNVLEKDINISLYSFKNKAKEEEIVSALWIFETETKWKEAFLKRQSQDHILINL